MAKTRTLTAEVDGKVYTKKTPREYRYFWICDAIHTSGRVQRNAACGWRYKPVDKDGKHPSLGAGWQLICSGCFRILHS